MKKLILISIMFIGLSTSAQIIYQPTFFGGSYLMDGQYVGETQFKSMLLKIRWLIICGMKEHQT